MSKQNKVNPGQYTQAGRLSPDDAARELRKMQPDPHDAAADDGNNARTSAKSPSRSPAQKETDSKEP